MRRNRVTLLVLLASCLLIGGGSASATDQLNQARLDRTVRFLQDVQNADGGFGGRRGSESDPGFTAWVAMALAAAGINPHDQAKPGGEDAFTYLQKHSKDFSVTTDFERVLLTVTAAGDDPYDFGGMDLAHAITSRQLRSGGFPHEAGNTNPGVNDTSFAVLALASTKNPRHRPAIDKGMDWLLSVQKANGSWSSMLASGTPSSDITASVIEALNAGGRTNTVAQQRAFDWLKSIQNDDGGFGEGSDDGASNVASTAWVAQALWSAGIDPRSWRKSGGDLLDYLASMQNPDGSISWKKGNDLNPVWMTSYATPAFAGRQLPIPPVPRTSVAAPPPKAPADPGTGGADKTGGGVVIAGGGGNGSELFTAPQPQSQGKTAGGVREIDATTAKKRAAAKAQPRPGAAAPEASAVSAATSTEAASGTGPGSSAATPATTKAPKSTASTDGLEVITGRQLSDAEAAGPAVPAAPGLRGARRTDNGPVIAAVMAALLLLALIGGGLIERREPRARHVASPTPA